MIALFPLIGFLLIVVGFILIHYFNKESEMFRETLNVTITDVNDALDMMGKEAREKDRIEKLKKSFEMNATLKALGNKDLLGEKSYYVVINFDDIRRVESLFNNNSFLKNTENPNQFDFQESAIDFLSDPDVDFFERIDEAIINIVGGKNCHRVGQGFSEKTFHISYHFRKLCFFESMNKLKDFFEYLKISDITKFYDSTDVNEENHRFIYFNQYQKTIMQ